MLRPVYSPLVAWEMPLPFTLARFYRGHDDFTRLHHRLKLTPCPHCKETGALILHGFLYGYSEQDECQKSRRGRRVFCNNRKTLNNGCGHTFSVWAADKFRRLRLGANALLTFVKGVLQLGNKAHALRTLNLDVNISSAYRIWKRFVNSQSHIRAALTQCIPPPNLPMTNQPADQTIAHLEAAFPHESSPIAAFQHRLQISFL